MVAIGIPRRIGSWTGPPRKQPAGAQRYNCATILCVPRDVEQQGEDHDGNERQHHVEQNSSQPRRAPFFPVLQLRALLNADLVLVFQIEANSRALA